MKMFSTLRYSDSAVVISGEVLWIESWQVDQIGWPMRALAANQRNSRMIIQECHPNMAREYWETSARLETWSHLALAIRNVPNTKMPRFWCAQKNALLFKFSQRQLPVAKKGNLISWFLTKNRSPRHESFFSWHFFGDNHATFWIR